MSEPRRPADRRPEEEGATTQTSGTPMPVDVAADPSTRRAMALFLAGPVVWFTHFVVVYLVAEAGCTGSGPGLEVFAPPVPAVVAVVATVVAVVACLAVAWWEWRRWRVGAARTPREGALEQPEGMGDDRRGGPLALTGLLLALLSAVAVVFVGLPAVVLPGC